jgi:hypothetical protein
MKTTMSAKSAESMVSTTNENSAILEN